MVDAGVQIPLDALTTVPDGWSLQTLLTLFHKETSSNSPLKLLVSLALATSAAVNLGVWESLDNPPVWGTGNRWFKSSHSDCERERQGRRTGEENATAR